MSQRRARWPHTTTDNNTSPTNFPRGQQELQGEPKCRHLTTGQELQSPCGTNADSRILYFSDFFTFAFLGAKRLALWSGRLGHGVSLPHAVHWAFLIFLILFHISFFFLPEGWSTEQQTKDGSPGPIPI